MAEATPRPLTGTWWQDPNDNRIHDAAGNDVLDYLPVTEIGKRVNSHDALVAALELWRDWLVDTEEPGWIPSDLLEAADAALEAAK